MSNSKLVNYVKISPHKNVDRKYKIDRITPHCLVGQASAESIGEWLANPSTKASCNYAVDKDGRIGMYVEEKDRSWCSSSGDNDNRAVTIECASDKTEPYAFRDVVYESLIKLCVDICKRNGKTKLIWFGDKEKTLAYKPADDEMLITVHRWFAAKSCPGNWLYSRLGSLAKRVTNELGGGKITEEVEYEKNEPDEPIYYRVQTGAFTIKENAIDLAEKLKAKCYDIYIVQHGGFYKVQVGAYTVKKNADIMADKLEADGFDTYITTKSGTPVEATTKKSNAEIAKEIFNLTCSDPRWKTWGTGATRVERLKAAGYDPVAVQKEVNKLF